MTTEDSTPPPIQIVPNHTPIRRNGRFETLHTTPLPGDFADWLDNARRLGYYTPGPTESHALNFPIEWASPEVLRMWSAVGAERTERLLMQGFADRPEGIAPQPLSELLADRLRAALDRLSQHPEGDTDRDDR